MPISVDAIQLESGLATFGPEALQVLQRLDDYIRMWAEKNGATEIRFPPIVPAADLNRVDYFENFPHLGLAVAPLVTESLPKKLVDDIDCDRSIDSRLLSDSRYLLPSAACYPVYSSLKNRTLHESQILTTVQQCFRNEEHFEGISRLLSFSMREVVVVGSQKEVVEILKKCKEWVSAFAVALQLELSINFATDPFFDSDKAQLRQKMQKLFPTKQEYCYKKNVALSSINFHRNFFGERWNIRTQDGNHAFSGCVAFGLERWLHALLCNHGESFGELLTLLESVLGNDHRYPIFPPESGNSV